MSDEEFVQCLINPNHQVPRSQIDEHVKTCKFLIDPHHETQITLSSYDEPRPSTSYQESLQEGSSHQGGSQIATLPISGSPFIPEWRSLNEPVIQPRPSTSYQESSQEGCSLQEGSSQQGKSQKSTLPISESTSFREWRSPKEPEIQETSPSKLKRLKPYPKPLKSKEISAKSVRASSKSDLSPDKQSKKGLLEMRKETYLSILSRRRKDLKKLKIESNSDDTSSSSTDSALSLEDTMSDNKKIILYEIGLEFKAQIPSTSQQSDSSQPAASSQQAASSKQAVILQPPKLTLEKKDEKMDDESSVDLSSRFLPEPSDPLEFEMEGPSLPGDDQQQQEQSESVSFFAETSDDSIDLQRLSRRRKMEHEKMDTEEIVEGKVSHLLAEVTTPLEVELEEPSSSEEVSLQQSQPLSFHAALSYHSDVSDQQKMISKKKHEEMDTEENIVAETSHTLSEVTTQLEVEMEEPSLAADVPQPQLQSVSSPAEAQQHSDRSQKSKISEEKILEKIDTEEEKKDEASPTSSEVITQLEVELEELSFVEEVPLQQLQSFSFHAASTSASDDMDKRNDESPQADISHQVSSSLQEDNSLQGNSSLQEDSLLQGGSSLQEDNSLPEDISLQEDSLLQGSSMLQEDSSQPEESWGEETSDMLIDQHSIETGSPKPTSSFQEEQSKPRVSRGKTKHQLDIPQEESKLRKRLYETSSESTDIDIGDLLIAGSSLKSDISPKSDVSPRKQKFLEIARRYDSSSTTDEDEDEKIDLEKPSTSSLIQHSEPVVIPGKTKHQLEVPQEASRQKKRSHETSSESMDIDIGDLQIVGSSLKSDISPKSDVSPRKQKFLEIARRYDSSSTTDEDEDEKIDLEKPSTSSLIQHSEPIVIPGKTKHQLEVPQEASRQKKRSHETSSESMDIDIGDLQIAGSSLKSDISPKSDVSPRKQKFLEIARRYDSSSTTDEDEDEKIDLEKPSTSSLIQHSEPIVIPGKTKHQLEVPQEASRQKKRSHETSSESMDIDIGDLQIAGSSLKSDISPKSDVSPRKKKCLEKRKPYDSSSTTDEDQSEEIGFEKPSSSVPKEQSKSVVSSGKTKHQLDIPQEASKVRKRLYETSSESTDIDSGDLLISGSSLKSDISPKSDVSPRKKKFLEIARRYDSSSTTDEDEDEKIDLEKPSTSSLIQHSKPIVIPGKIKHQLDIPQEASKVRKRLYETSSESTDIDIGDLLIAGSSLKSDISQKSDVSPRKKKFLEIARRYDSSSTTDEDEDVKIDLEKPSTSSLIQHSKPIVIPGKTKYQLEVPQEASRQKKRSHETSSESTDIDSGDLLIAGSSLKSDISQKSDVSPRKKKFLEIARRYDSSSTTDEDEDVKIDLEKPSTSSLIQHSKPIVIPGKTKHQLEVPQEASRQKKRSHETSSESTDIDSSDLQKSSSPPKSAISPEVDTSQRKKKFLEIRRRFETSSTKDKDKDGKIDLEKPSTSFSKKQSTPVVISGEKKHQLDVPQESSRQRKRSHETSSESTDIDSSDLQKSSSPPKSAISPEVDTSERKKKFLEIRKRFEIASTKDKDTDGKIDLDKPSTSSSIQHSKPVVSSGKTKHQLDVPQEASKLRKRSYETSSEGTDIEIDDIPIASSPPKSAISPKGDGSQKKKNF